jgi:hypothetical protein
VKVITEPQLLQVFRYILLNPYVAKICSDPINYEWSSFKEIALESKEIISNSGFIEENFGDTKTLTDFVTDYLDYADQIHCAKKFLHDPEE